MKQRNSKKSFFFLLFLILIFGFKPNLGNAQEGEYCNNLDKKCPEGFYCQFLYEGGRGKCTKQNVAQEGADCGSANIICDESKGLKCLYINKKWTCKVPKKIGEECQESSECESKNCVQGKCALPSSCKTNQDCPTGYECTIGQCTPLGGGTFTLPSPTLQVPIPQLKFSEAKVVQEGKGVKTINIPYLVDYIVGVYNFLLSAAGILAGLMIIFGGLQWLLAFGDANKIGEAKKRISNAITGLALLFGTYLILYLINPEILALKGLRITLIEPQYYGQDEVLGGEELSEIVKIAGKDMVYITNIPHLTVLTTHGELPMLQKVTAQKLQEALTNFHQAENGKYAERDVVITSAFRTWQEQCRLYQLICHTDTCEKKVDPKQCDKPVCWPGPESGVARCSHSTGQAVDIWCKGERSDTCKHKNGEYDEKACPCHVQLEKSLKDAGFCRLNKEMWHFEYPKMSPGCY